MHFTLLYYIHLYETFYLQSLYLRVCLDIYTKEFSDTLSDEPINNVYLFI